jgi:hypothetical protein
MRTLSYSNTKYHFRSVGPIITEACRIAAGATLHLISSVIAKEIDYGIVLVCPAGHHSSTDQIGTLCGLNSISTGAVQVIQSSLRILSEKMQSDIGFLRKPVFSLEKPVGSDLDFAGIFAAGFRTELRRRKFDRSPSNPTIGYCRNRSNLMLEKSRIMPDSTMNLAGFCRNLESSRNVSPKQPIVYLF